MGKKIFIENIQIAARMLSRWQGRLTQFPPAMSTARQSVWVQIDPSVHKSGLLERSRRIDRQARWGTTPSLNLTWSRPGSWDYLGTIYPAAEFVSGPGHQFLSPAGLLQSTSK